MIFLISIITDANAQLVCPSNILPTTPNNVGIQTLTTPNKLIIADETGRERYQTIDLCIGKPCQLKVSAQELQTGVYVYGILLNGKMVKSQKMMIIK